MERDNAVTDVFLVVGQTGGQRTELLSDHPANGSQQGKHTQGHQHHREGARQTQTVEGIDDGIEEKGKEGGQRQGHQHCFAKIKDHDQKHADDQTGERNRSVFFDGGGHGG